jgi:hypothetical protein
VTMFSIGQLTRTMREPSKLYSVIPADAGIQGQLDAMHDLDSRLRGNDVVFMTR